VGSYVRTDSAKLRFGVAFQSDKTPGEYRGLACRCTGAFDNGERPTLIFGNGPPVRAIAMKVVRP
jgi:hypothetical protein